LTKPFTIERCRAYVENNKKKGSVLSNEVKAIEWCLEQIEKLTPKQETERVLSIEAGERWLDRWHDVPIETMPHSVRLLFLYSDAVKHLRYQREQAITELRRLIGEADAMKGTLKLTYEMMTLNQKEEQ